MPNESVNRKMSNWLPFSYLIDYASGHIGNEEYYRRVAEAPPKFLHLGQDVVFSADLGLLCRQGELQDLRDIVDRYSKYISPDRAQDQVAKVKEHVRRLHELGVEKVIVYLCNSRLFGNHIERTGFWSFFDYWEEFSGYGFGPRPPADPIEWMTQAREIKGEAGYYNRVVGIYERSRADPHRAFYSYWPCANNPYWRQMVQAVIRWIAKCGYDGVFLDVNETKCYCRYCRDKFRERMISRYTAEELRDEFGILDTKKIYPLEEPLPPYSQPFELPVGWESRHRALWAETQAFCSECSADFHTFCLTTAREVNPNFIFTANAGPLFTNQAMVWRTKFGLDITRWSTESNCTLIEDNQYPGMIGELIIDNCFAYQLCRASGQRAALLLSSGQGYDAIKLAMAEAGAGGGCTIQGGYAYPKVRRQFDRFWESHGNLFTGKSSFSNLLLIYSPDEIYHGNTSNLRQTRQIIEHLSDHHITFDLRLLKNIDEGCLSQYRVVILPCINNIKPEQLNILRNYSASGRQVVILDSLTPGTKLPRGSPWSGLFPGHRVKPSAHSEGVVWAASIGELMPEKDLYPFDMTEGEMNDFKRLLSRVKDAEKGNLSVGRQPPGRLIEIIDRACGRTASLATDAPRHVRFRAFVSNTGEARQTIVHILNYNLHRDDDGRGLPAIPAEDLKLVLPLTKRTKIKSVRKFVPGEEPMDLAWERTEGSLISFIPKVDVYAVVDVQFSIG